MGTAVASEAPARVELRGSVLADGRVVAAIIAVVLAIYVVADLGHTYDDPFILMRYAQNLLGGHGWTFNPDVVTANAATSTGYVLLLAGLGAVGLPLPVAGTVLFVTGMAAAAGFTFLTYRGAGGGTAAILLLLSPQLINVRGMETAVLLGLVAATVWAAHVHRDVLAALLLVAVAVVRPDGVLLAPAVVVWWRVDVGEWPRRMIAVGAIAGALAGVTLAATVGIPSTLAAKIAQGRSPYWDTFGGGWRDVAVAAAPWWALAGVGSMFNRQWRSPAIWYGGAFVVAYLALGVAAYPWYYAVPIYAAAVAGGAGLERAGGRMALAAVAVIGAFTWLVASPSLPAGRDDLRAAAEWISYNTDSGTVVGATEIGIVGMVSDRTVVDPLGLVDESDSGRVADGGLGSWLTDRHPDVWIHHRLAGPLEQAVFDVPAGSSYVPVFTAGTVTVMERVSW